MAADLDPLLVRVLSKSRFRTCWRINRPYLPECLNVIVIGRTTPDRFLGGCSYVGALAIICDGRFLDGYLASVGALAGIESAERRASIDRAFRHWVLAHEVGHAELGHEPRPMFVTQGAAFDYHKLEVDADKKAIELGMIDDDNIFEEMLVRLFNASYTQSYGSTLDGVPPLKYDRFMQLPYRLYASHPHMTLRVTGLLLAHRGFQTTTRISAKFFLNRVSGAPGLVDRLGLDMNGELDSGDWRLRCYPYCSNR